MKQPANTSYKQNYLIIGFIIASYVWLMSYTPNAQVQGESMTPTLYDQERLYITQTKQIKRNQIVVIKNEKKKSYIVKRVIGIAGDDIAYRQGLLRLNGTYYTEPYINQEEARKKGLLYATDDFTLYQLTGHHTIPKGYVFVLGDNRSNSVDSREYGLIAESEIVGEVTSYRAGIWKKPIDKTDKEKIGNLQ